MARSESMKCGVRKDFAFSGGMEVSVEYMGFVGTLLHELELLGKRRPHYIYDITRCVHTFVSTPSVIMYSTCGHIRSEDVFEAVQCL